MQLRMSPGGMTPRSSRKRPELPPSSVTVTMTERSAGPFFRPRSSVESPVPPPMEPNLSLWLFKALLFRRGYQILERLFLGEDREVIVLLSLKTVFSPVVNGLF